MQAAQAVKQLLCHFIVQYRSITRRGIFFTQSMWKLNVAMEFVFDEIHIGRLTFVLSLLEKQGYSILITAKDEENRRLWKTPLMDGHGNIICYSESERALAVGREKVAAFNRPEAIE